MGNLGENVLTTWVVMPGGASGYERTGNLHRQCACRWSGIFNTLHNIHYANSFSSLVDSGMPVPYVFDKRIRTLECRKMTAMLMLSIKM
jgi:hypothetical protein